VDVSPRWHPISLFDADPDLVAGVPDEEREIAQRSLIIPTIALEPGLWTPPTELPFALLVGLLVLAGVLSREIVFAGRRTSELLGPGDIVRPWDEDGPYAVSSTVWRVHAPLRIAVLDARVARACGRWPAVGAAVGTRHSRRAQLLARRLAIAQLPAVADRLLLTFCDLATRWGRVTPQGIRVPVPLTHTALAALVGARRPSVTTALGLLAGERVVERVPDGWLLHEDIEALAARVDEPGLRFAAG
jgi:CRP/FNR family transcriptional regulator, cyclic AMP receptor protein